MPSRQPEWWHRAGPDVRKAMSDFAGWLRNGMATVKPHQLVVKNPYYLRRSRGASNDGVDWDRPYDLIMMPTNGRPR